MFSVRGHSRGMMKYASASSTQLDHNSVHSGEGGRPRRHTRGVSVCNELVVGLGHELIEIEKCAHD